MHADRQYLDLTIPLLPCLCHMHVFIDCQLNQQSFTFMYLHASSIKLEISCAFDILHMLAGLYVFDSTTFSLCGKGTKEAR